MRRLGASVLLVEAGPGLGGTSTRAGVNNYEPVAGATGLPQEIYDRLIDIPDAVTLQRPWATYHPDRPWGWTKPADETDYRLSLSRRSGVPIVFEPDILDRVMQDMLTDADCRIVLKTRFTKVNYDRKHIHSIVIEDPNGSKIVEANLFIDATADIYLARAAGCRTAIGVEAREVYNEPTAPEQPGLVLNNASLCYRITPLKDGETPQIQSLPDEVDIERIRPVTSIRTYPNGDLNMNPLHMMSGVEAYELEKSAYEEAEKKIYAHWHMLQTNYEFDRWRLVWISPMLGVRGSYRLIGQYVLREQDLETGLEAQTHPDIIAFADHALDFHGLRPSRQMTNGPYGIPFRCLLTKEIDNLLVACRGASFSSIAASSCRLSRTMMVLGQAAGTAAALFGKNVQHYDARALRDRLKQNGVALALSEGYLEAMPGVTPLQTPRW